MITKMKKLTFLVYHKEYEQFLEQIRALGVVHIVEKQQGTADNAELQESVRLTTRLQTALNQLQAIGKAPQEAPASAASGKEVLQEVETLQAEKGKLQQQLQNLQKEAIVLEPWGNFEPDSLSRLHDAGITVGFYTCPESTYDAQWEALYTATVIHREASRIYFVTFTRNSMVMELTAEQVKLPAESLSRIKARCAEMAAALAACEARLKALAETGQEALKVALQAVNRDMEFSKVLLNTESVAAEKLMLLQGWAPVTKESEITAWLDTQQLYYDISNPTPDDEVPILLNNKGFLAWFEPICKLYMLPKYNELDLTPYFAPFFMIFFGLCLGDSGYGLFLVLAVTGYRLLAKNISQTMKPMLSLVQLLGASTFFCGFLTGTFFGFNIYDIHIPFIQSLKAHVFQDNNAMFQLSLILGVIQILFGMVLKAVNQSIQFGFRYALGTIGWIVLLASCVFAAVLPAILPMGGTVHLYILGASAVLIFLFNSPGKNIFLNIGLGLWDSYNMATGLLGDILSYVRLFALGLSGGILASVFNTMSVGMSPDHVIFGPFVMVLIFVIGHAINLFMNVLGAMVHPMRLTFVEFFKNSGYEGGGQEYAPFKN
ncbi:MAG: V-type ATP synthase subunit I [Prevotellaceae bacterium]|jgi:V/A-type H+-transporting ATPase subunit I|nr:V-type ATP synthase subunit I [Prevotellaceae bacterium]